MKIFHRQIAFAPIDPLGDGLREQIEAEQREAEAIRLEEDLGSESVSEAWEEIVHQVEQDPEWFTFASEE